MADEVKMDKDGYILEGRFAGKHISTIVTYAQSLEDAIPEEDRPKPKAKPTTPADELERHATGRVDTATALMAKRFLSDDEQSFRATVGEEVWKKYGENIGKIAASLAPAQQMQKGIHWAIYIQMRAGDPEFVKSVLAQPKEEEHQETEEEKAAREAREAEGDEEQPPVPEKKAAAPPPPPPVKPVPKAAPPTVPPTSRDRTPPPSQKKPKLVANEKIIHAARVWGTTTEAYLLQLEARGVTQAELETISIPKEETRRKSVFDRKVAG